MLQCFILVFLSIFLIYLIADLLKMMRVPGLVGVYLLLPVLHILPVSVGTQDSKPDPQGYVMYCPCMGRFGNQADHFLGSLGFAKGLDRTLVLPPWIEYQTGRRGSVMVPFDSYFNITKVSEFQRVVTMEYFFDHLADSVWPPGERISFCYGERRGPIEQSCNAKDGNPFGPFWDTYNVSFDRSEMYGPLSYDVYHQDAGTVWNRNYPPEKFPVLAFTGAPASFPVQLDNVKLQEFVVFNEFWRGLAENWVKRNLPKGPFVGIHLRNGMDWDKACEHISSSNHLFSSPQCLGYRNENGELYHELCIPSDSTIVKQIKKAVKKVGAVAIFIASDNDFMIRLLSEKLKNLGVSLHHQDEGDSIPHLDLAILSRSNFFIGNCISSFSAFVKRSRDVEGLPSGFWGYPRPRNSHDEL